MWWATAINRKITEFYSALVQVAKSDALREPSKDICIKWLVDKHPGIAFAIQQ